jgi:hypothetical protein
MLVIPLLLLLLLPPLSCVAAPDWIPGTGHRHAPLTVATNTTVGLRLTDPQTTGLAFTNTIPESRHLTNQVLLNGSGIAAGDVDGDGRTDVFCAGFDNDNALFRNLGGWRFENVAAQAGVALPGLDCTGAAFADLDGDGDLDLVVNTLGQGTHLLHNDGQGRFTRSPTVLNPGRAGMTAALADFDGDGRPDLYIANYRTRALMDMPGIRMTFKKEGNRTVVDTLGGRPATDPEFAGRFQINENGGIEENGEIDVLYRNLDGSRFEEVPWTGGAFRDESGRALQEPPRDWGLAAMFHDVNHDGRPDLYVCNDFQSPDRLWLNQGGGRFQLAPALSLRRTSLSSMAVDFADINRDGHDDFVVLEMMTRDHRQRMRWVRENFPHRPVIGRYDDRPQLEQNTLQLGRGDGSWAEIAQLSGVEATEWAWACAFLDVDLDGWSDLLVVNGMERAGRDQDVADRLRAARQGKRVTEADIFQGRRMFPRLATPNVAFRNRGDLTFADTSRDWGFDLAAVSQTLALADLDDDGDLDVLVGNLNAAVAAYRNDAPGPRIAVRLAGRSPNTRGIGARIELIPDPAPSTATNAQASETTVALRSQTSEVTAGGRYLAGDDFTRAFAAPGPGRFTCRVRWPGGGRSEIPGIAPNTLLEITEPETPNRTPDPAPPVTAPATAGFRFEEVSALIQHRHTEEAFDDFTRQPLLPHKLSQPGPGVAWLDLDGDGDDDLALGAGRGGRIAIFRNEGSGQLSPWNSPALANPLDRDTTALIAWPQAGGRSRLLAAQANYEDGAALGPAVVSWDSAKNSLEEIVPADDSSPGPLALADIDGDGDLDLFVGGRVIPGQWPAAATSRFLRNDRERFVPDNPRSRVLAGIGRVSGAVFTDFDNDGDSDLVLACEWGPVRLLRQDRDVFTDLTAPLGLASATGWWTSVAAGDFDGDGRMDFVAGNWGRNTPYERFRRIATPGSQETPAELRLYHGDFNGDGIFDVLEAHADGTPDRFVPREPLTALGPALPFLRERFATHTAFGEADIPRILGAAAAQARIERATWLESTVFLNRGDHFEPRPLPVQAQSAPAMGIAVADADGDGRLDVFLAQNFFAVRPHTPRYDAGTGLWLRGDGHGGFTAVPADTAGIRIDGEQRGAAVGDYDGDGRIDLVVGQNGAATRLFRNLGARPGLRVRLQGPAANPAAIGARIGWKGEMSIGHELHAGTSALSQNSLVAVLAPSAISKPLVVKWPGGKTTDYEVPPDAREVAVSMTELRLVR